MLPARKFALIKPYRHPGQVRIGGHINGFSLYFCGVAGGRSDSASRGCRNARLTLGQAPGGAMTQAAGYDEFGMLGDNATEAGLPFSVAPTVTRRAFTVTDGQLVSAAWRYDLFGELPASLLDFTGLCEEADRRSAWPRRVGQREHLRPIVG
jgi:hypothetical protein